MGVGYEGDEGDTLTMDVKSCAAAARVQGAGEHTTGERRGAKKAEPDSPRESRALVGE